MAESLNLRISEIEHGGHLVEVAGEVDVLTAPQLDAALAAITDGDIRLDLSGVPFLDSTGLHVLVRAHHAASQRGNDLVIHRAQPIVHRVVKVTGLDEVLHLDGPPPAEDD